MVALNRILTFAEKKGVSDIHIKNNRVCMRTLGTIMPPSFSTSPEEVKAMLSSLLDQAQLKTFEQSGDVDFAFEHFGVRYRANAYHDMHGIGIALRRLGGIKIDFDSLGVPSKLRELSHRRNGLILVTGPTGSGKSTTLACIIENLNKTEYLHIITLEDPIEYVFDSDKCVITQREIGRDVSTFASGLKAALRQDPDVIMLGEMRDRESISTALTAAETGHLVLSTLHTKGAENTIDRIVDTFPPEQQSQIRAQLSMVLIGICSQQLVPSVDGGRVLASEMIISSPAIKNIVRSGRTHQLRGTMQTSSALGMYTMDDSLVSLYNNGKITEEEMKKYTLDN